MSYRILYWRPRGQATRLSVCYVSEAVLFTGKRLLLSKTVGTQALQVIENTNYLLDCHAGGRGFESRPLRRCPVYLGMLVLNCLCVLVKSSRSSRL